MLSARKLFVATLFFHSYIYIHILHQLMVGTCNFCLGMMISCYVLKRQAAAFDIFLQNRFCELAGLIREHGAANGSLVGIFGRKGFFINC